MNGFTVTRIVLAGAIAAPVVGCRAEARRRRAAQPPSVVHVQATTQPASTGDVERAAFPDTGGEVRRVEVRVDEKSASPPASLLADRHRLVGRNCRLVFRGDALGVALPAPMSLTGGTEFRGRPDHFQGKVIHIDDHWVVIDKYWVPVSAVLAVYPLD